MEKREAAAKGKGTVTKVVPVEHSEAPIPENINRIVIDGEVASSVDEAIKVLRYTYLHFLMYKYILKFWLLNRISDSPADVERHPEKRMKAAYAAFEEKHIPRLREENPNMRLSQIKQMLHR